jgi:hypothetical protein
MTSKVVAALMLGVFTVAQTLAVVLAVPNGNLRAESGFFLVAIAAFMGVGALIVALRPDNRVGWVFSAIGLLASLGLLAQEYSEYGYVTRPGSLPFPVIGAWVVAWYWLLLLSLMFIFTLLLFPTGRLASPSWRPVAWVAWIGTVAITVSGALNPMLQLQDEDYSVPNPIGVAAVGDVEESTAGGVLLVVFVLSMAAAFVSLVIRFRRSQGVERQQLKWFTYAGTLLLAMLMISIVIEDVLGLEASVGGDFVFFLLIAFLPISAGIAILRYRLYDIDLVINRTLVYGSLTVLLGAVYVAGAVGLPTLVPLAADNDLVVAGSTLAVAALFSPLRRRVQGFVDRRFYRSRYDARRTVEQFSSRLRDQVDLEDLVGGLTSVVRETLQPASVGVWLSSTSTGRAGRGTGR